MKRQSKIRDFSIRTKMLVIILPLIVVPMLILAAVGFITSSREAATVTNRYLAQRENDLRTIAENQAIRDYFNNRLYGLSEEAEIYRAELEHSLNRFADRSNNKELIYPIIRYVDETGLEIAKVAAGEAAVMHGQIGEAEFFAAARDLGPDEVYLSPVRPTMIYAMPVHEFGGADPVFQGVVAIDFVYPIEEFRRTTEVIAATFVIITAISLAVALFLTIDRVRRLTDPIRRLAEAANLIAAGQRSIAVDLTSRDEIGRLAASFNEMASSLEENEAALQRKVEESTALYEIGREITAQITLEPTLQLIVERARDLLAAEVSLLAMRQEDGDVFEMQAHSGTLTPALAELRFRPGEGLGGKVAETGRPVIVGDYLAEYRDSPFVEIVQEGQLCSAVAVPLIAHEESIGVLYVHSPTPNKFAEDDSALLSALATQATISIENAKLYQQVKQDAEQLEANVKARTQELRQANLKLQEASRHKSEFLANMSHELRTPMNAIIGFNRLVMRRCKDILPQKHYENMQKIGISADHLLSLINDILDLSKVEAGRMEVHPAEFALAPLVELCLRTVEPMVKSERLRLEKRIEPALPTLFNDQDKLKQVLMNLLSNAAKFTDDGAITVSAEGDGERIAIAVTDTGIGIPAVALDLIFEEFRQVDTSSTRQHGGTGLGLSISRHLTELMGGTISIDSTVGVGSTFTVNLPLRYRSPGPTEPVGQSDASPGSEPESVAAPAAGASDGPIVLAIDDDPNVIYLLQENLAEAGYRVVGAANTEEGLRKARSLKPYAVTLDILMPQQDGWQALQQIKADAATRDIPVIVLSIVDEKDRGYRLGAFDYLLKPFDRNAILGTLRRIPGAGHRLLVVDDDPAVVDIVRQLLDGAGYEIEACEDGATALRAIAERRPDIVLLDLLMPGMDGFAVIERLQADPECRDIPIIVLTAKTLTVEDSSWLQQRVRKVIGKSRLDREALMAELRKALPAYGRASAKG